MYILHKVHPLLSAFIDSYWESTFEQMHEPLYDELFVAQLYPNIIINLSEDYHRNTERINSTTLIGINTSPIHFLHKSTNQLFGIRFKPSGLSVFLPICLHEIANISVSLPDIFGQKGLDLTNRIIDATNSAERIKITEEFFFRHINEHLLDKWRFYQLAQEQLMHLCTESNAIPILVKKMNTTQRTFDRHFQQILGLSPKKISRLLRFQKVFAAMHQPNFRLSQFNYYEMGYYDQAHFSKEFKEFSGFAPQVYLASEYFVQNLQADH
ncbi:MAG: DUF6597 domain-containing transcriptional factor [Saprospiraceae bacterium]